MVDRVSFGGEIFAGQKIVTKMEQYVALPGDLVISKIRARQGSIGLVEPSHGTVSVSIHYRAVTPNTELLDPVYAWLALRSSFCRAQFLAATGGAMKGEISEASLLQIEIPLPPLAVQKAIVLRWQEAQTEIAAARARVEKRKAEIDTRFFADLDLKSPAQVFLPKAFAVWWRDTEKWGVQQILQFALRAKDKSKYTEFSLSDLCNIGSGGTPSRRIKNYFGGAIPWVKTTEVVNGEITTTEETLTDDGLKNSSAKLYPKGSLLVAMYGQGATRGRTAKLGIDAATNQACAVLFNIKPEIETDFLWYFLISQYDAMRALASGNNQPNLNAEMIANLKIPLPSLSVQREIVARVALGRAEIAREREAAASLAVKIESEIEARILGIK